MSTPGGDRRFFITLIVAIITSLIVGFLGAYLVVVSQNPASVTGTTTDYGVIQ